MNGLTVRELFSPMNALAEGVLLQYDYAVPGVCTVVGGLRPRA